MTQIAVLSTSVVGHGMAAYVWQAGALLPWPLAGTNGRRGSVGFAVMPQEGRASPNYPGACSGLSVRMSPPNLPSVASSRKSAAQPAAFWSE